MSNNDSAIHQQERSSDGNSSDSVHLTLKDWRLDRLSPNGTTVVNVRMGERHDYTFPSSIIRGRPHPPFIQEHVWEAQKALLNFREGDIFVTTMSKCGTTLAEQVVLLLLNGGNAEELNPLHKNTLDPRSGTNKVGKIWTEMAVIDGLGLDNDGDKATPKACIGEGKARMSAQEFDSLSSPRILKTHAPRDLFLAENSNGSLVIGVKVLYVTRNPFDACVSCYYHPKPGISPHSTGMPFDAFARLWLSDRVEFGGWVNHLKGWREEYELPSMSDAILWISYEDIVDHPIESIKVIAKFIRVDATPSLIERVAAGCKFDNVKKAAEDAIATGRQGDLSHLRRGKVGDWRNHFSNSLRQEFEQELSEQLRGVDVKYSIGEGEFWSPSRSVSRPGEEVLENKMSDQTIPIEAKRLIDIKIFGITVIFYAVLQTSLQYVNEFHVDDLRDQNDLTQPKNFPAVSLVIANIFNGVNGGLALSTAIVSGQLIHTQWMGDGYNRQGRFVWYFFISIVLESLATSGVLHSVAHRLFGATLDGNSWVEFFSHLGYSINVIITAICTLLWLGPQYFTNQTLGVRPGWYPKWWEITIAIILSTLAILFTQLWVPYQPHAEDYDYRYDHPYNEARIILIQGRIQGVIEGVLLIPTVIMLFMLGRLWKAIGPVTDELSRTTYRISILAVALPLCFNWIHFRCHDDLVHPIQQLTGWVNNETIAAIRMIFHVPNWIFAIARLHYFRIFTERNASWPALDVIETICPGRDIFPFLMIFLYRATEGMTLALLPSFFQDGNNMQKFHLDITDNAWVAATIVGMFVGNALGAVGLGRLMQWKGYRFAYTFACSSSVIVLPLHMISHTNASFLVVRCISALIFPGPIVLSQITKNTRQTFTNSLKHVPMVVSLVWFNQGFWFGGAISNSSVWAPSNVFFVSAAILASLFLCLLVAFVPNDWLATKARRSTPTPSIKLATASPGSNYTTIDTETGNTYHSDDAKVIKNYDTGPSANQKRWGGLWLEKMASLANGASFACHISLLGIQITKLADLDVYEYTTIIASLGSISTVLILSSYQCIAKKSTPFVLSTGCLGHMVGTGILSIPQIYVIPNGVALVTILISYAFVLLSFFVMNLSCEVSLAQKSLKQQQQVKGKDAADGMQMGIIKTFLSVGKVLGASLTATTFSIHPQLPLWILGGFLSLAYVIGNLAIFLHRRSNGSQRSLVHNQTETIILNDTAHTYGLNDTMPK